MMQRDGGVYNPDGAEPTKEEMRAQVSNVAWWSYWRYYEWHWLFVNTLVPKPADDELLDKINMWLKANSADMWLPFEEVAIVSERHTFLTLDAEGRLHNETGPAWAWADGTEIYAWHGLRVPSWVILNPTVEQIQNESNIEIRRCAIEHLGWDRWIESADLQPVQSDKFGDLYSLPDDLDTRIVLVVNGTPERDGTIRRYGIPVPSSCSTALEAVAWSYDLAPEVYAKIERRT
jgi:hypothetical protein